MLTEDCKRRCKVSPIRGTSCWAGGMVSCRLVGSGNDNLGGAEGSGPRNNPEWMTLFKMAVTQLVMSVISLFNCEQITFLHSYS